MLRFFFANFEVMLKKCEVRLKNFRFLKKICFKLNKKQIILCYYVNLRISQNKSWDYFNILEVRLKKCEVKLKNFRFFKKICFKLNKKQIILYSNENLRISQNKNWGYFKIFEVSLKKCKAGIKHFGFLKKICIEYNKKQIILCYNVNLKQKLRLLDIFEVKLKKYEVRMNLF